MIETVFEDYHNREQEFYSNLSDEDMRKFGLENRSFWAAAIRYSTCIEILATLEGIKPCVLFQTDTKASDSRPVFDKHIKTYVSPWFEQHRLAQSGFVLQRINHDLIIDGSDNWRGFWVFADTRSQNWTSVKDVFFNPKVPFQDSRAVGDALGLPILPILPCWDARYTYVDLTTRKKLEKEVGEEVGDLIAHDYVGSKDKVQEEEARAHFEKWREVGAKHGIELELRVGENPVET
jgi:hypothetical protein